MTTQPPPSAPSSSRVIASLVLRMDEALTPLYDGSVPGAVHHGVVLDHVARAWEPLRMVLSRRHGNPIGTGDPSLRTDMATIALGRLCCALDAVNESWSLMTRNYIRSALAHGINRDDSRGEILIAIDRARDEARDMLNSPQTTSDGREGALAVLSAAADAWACM